MASKELQAIVAARERARMQGRACALVTVIRTSGSTYRRPGARMLVVAVSEDGGAETIGADFLGSISGGCLEDDAREHALTAIRTGKAAVVHYDTTAESDIFFGTGAGCQGTVDVFIEPLPLTNTVNDPLTCLARALRERRVGALASVVAVESPENSPLPGDFIWIDDSTRGSGTLTDPGLTNAIATDAHAAMFHRRTEMRRYRLSDGHADVFIQAIRPARSLLICGAGQDALPLARLAKEMGWRVRVVDGRRAYLMRERFPEADELIHSPASEFGARVAVERDEAVVIMTHNFLHDLDILRVLIPSSAEYIGVLGPRRRTERLLAELAASDPHLDLGKFSLGRLHGPAGLDIGAEAPEQIALAIIAEIEAATAGRDGTMLKHRSDTLHGSIG